MLAWIILNAAKLYCLIIFIQVLGSYFSSIADHPVVKKSHDFTDPLLDFIRKRIPGQAMGMDFSPMIAIVSIMVIAKFLAYLFG